MVGCCLLKPLWAPGALLSFVPFGRSGLVVPTDMADFPLAFGPAAFDHVEQPKPRPDLPRPNVPVDMFWVEWPPDELIVNDVDGLPSININGEEYVARPHELSPDFTKDMEWTLSSPARHSTDDPSWYDPCGQDVIAQWRIWAIDSEDGQVERFRLLLRAYPDRRLYLMAAAILRAKLHVVKFLLEQGIAAETNHPRASDNRWLPLHYAASCGQVECVRYLVETGRMRLTALDRNGETPLVSACSTGNPHVVEYLLERPDCPDPWSGPSSRDCYGYNALDHIIAAASIDCGQVLVTDAKNKGLSLPHLVTSEAVEMAAVHGGPVMLAAVLALGGCPRLGKNWDRDVNRVLTIPDRMKEAIESALRSVLSRGKNDTLGILLTYIQSRTESGQCNWLTLTGRTQFVLGNVGGQYARQRNEVCLLAYDLISDLTRNPRSHFTTQQIQGRREYVFSEHFCWAALYGSVKILKLIAFKLEKLDMNYLADPGPAQFTTAFFGAAGQGNDDAVRHICQTHGRTLDVHVGDGKFANGPTAAWAAVWNGHAHTVELVLKPARGPAEHIDETARPGNATRKVVLTATKAYRCPVRMARAATWTREHGGPGSAGSAGSVRGKDGTETNFVVMELKKEDTASWDRLQLRKRDEELVSLGRALRAQTETLRPLMERSAAA